MSYITAIPINTYRPEARKLLSSRQVAHATVLQSFPSLGEQPDGGRILWSVDTVNGKTNLTIVSPVKASPEHIVENCGWSAEPATSYYQSDYDMLLSSLSIGQEYNFSIVINPVTALTGTTKRIPVERDNVVDWVEQRLVGAGANTRDLHLESYGVETFRRGTGKVTLAIAKVTGKLVVNDASQLRQTLLNGVGRAKGYGCGLLMLNEKVS